MLEFVLDAPVVISWCFPGDPKEDTPYSRRTFQRLITADAIVPEIWAFEIANNIFVSHNKRIGINEQQVSEYVSFAQVAAIRVVSHDLWLTWSCNRWHDG